MKGRDLIKKLFGRDNNSEVLLDASFLLSLFDENDENNILSEEIMDKLEDFGWKIYITTHIHTEVLNRLYQGLFETDVINQIIKEETFNDYVSLLIDIFFTENEINDISAWAASFEGNPPLNFRIKWSRIFKSEYRDYLMPYIKEAINLFDANIVRYDIKVLSTCSLDYHQVSQIMEDHKLLVHDAYHIAACLSNGISYIATYDRDFNSIPEVKVLELVFVS